jgi:hypothetical protein
MELPKIPTLDLDQYIWKPDGADPKVWQRRGCGTEAIVGRESENNYGAFDIYLFVSLALGKDLSLATFKKAATEAMVHLRANFPQIALTLQRDDDFKPILRHVPPKDGKAAVEWAESHVIWDTTGRSTIQIRQSIEGERALKPSPLDAMTVYFSVPKDISTFSEGQEVELLIVYNHIFFDGSGTRFAAHKFCEYLAEIIAGKSALGEIASIKWDETNKGLSPAPTAIFNVQQILSGSVYEQSAATQMGKTMALMVSPKREIFKIFQPTRLIRILIIS